MSNVYDVIESLRNWKGYSLREVANRAGITYTTLASVMSRRSGRMSKHILDKVASVFDLQWYVLLNCKTENEPELFATGRFSSDPRVGTSLEKADVEQVLRKVIGDNYIQHMELSDSEQTKFHFQVPLQVPTQESSRNDRLRLQFKQSIDFVLNKLNDEGLMEAMRRVLDIAQDPKFCISTATVKKKEDDLCQEEDP